MNIRTVSLALAALVLGACGHDDGAVTVETPVPKDPAALAVLGKIKALGTEKERQDYMHAHQDEIMTLHHDPAAFAEAHKLAYGNGG